MMISNIKYSPEMESSIVLRCVRSAPGDFAKTASAALRSFVAEMTAKNKSDSIKIYVKVLDYMAPIE